MKLIRVVLSLLIFVVFACNSKNGEADAYGNFEVREILVSAETSGRILKMNIEEGLAYDENFEALKIDAKQSELKKSELAAKKMAIEAKKHSIKAQVNVNQEQLRVLRIEKQRLEKLVIDGAATTKQLDDINGQLQIIEKQILSIQSSFLSIDAEVKAIDAAILQVEDNISRSTVKIPQAGVVLAVYSEVGEVTAPGKALFKIANLDELELKAYISGSQLSSVSIGQEVNVFIDGKDDELINFKGILSWISSDAEFTPKNIQTKEERLSQVYAIKIKVKNNGSLKINMPAEVRFN